MPRGMATKGGVAGVVGGCAPRSLARAGLLALLLLGGGCTGNHVGTAEPTGGAARGDMATEQSAATPTPATRVSLISNYDSTSCLEADGFPTALMHWKSCDPGGLMHTFIVGGIDNNHLRFPAKSFRADDGTNYNEGTYCLSLRNLDGSGNLQPTTSPCDSSDNTEQWRQNADTWISVDNEMCLTRSNSSDSVPAVTMQPCLADDQYQSWTTEQSTQ
jgi:hypothetical protein